MDGPDDKFDARAQRAFASAKRTIVHKLRELIDYSPKGSIDAPIARFIPIMNSVPELVTTSSCSGRIAIYCFNSKQDIPARDVSASLQVSPTKETNQTSTKGAGKWLYVEHGFANMEHIVDALKSAWAGSTAVLKVEPFILHVQVSSLTAATRLLSVAIRANFRESGIVIGESGRGKIIVAIRSTSSVLDSPLIWEGNPIFPLFHNDENAVSAPSEHLKAVVAIANSLYNEVEKRREKFILEFHKEYAADLPSPSSASSKAINCIDCGEGFPSKNAMYKHHFVLSIDADQKVKKVCPRRNLVSAPQKSSISIIASATSKPLESDKLQLVCTGCGHEATSRNALFRHISWCEDAKLKKAKEADDKEQALKSIPLGRKGGLAAIRSVYPVSVDDLNTAVYAKQKAKALLNERQKAVSLISQEDFKKIGLSTYKKVSIIEPMTTSEEHENRTETPVQTRPSESSTDSSTPNASTDILSRWSHASASISIVDPDSANVPSEYILFFGGNSGSGQHSRKRDISLVHPSTGIAFQPVKVSQCATQADGQIICNDNVATDQELYPSARVRSAMAPLYFPMNISPAQKGGPSHPLSSASDSLAKATQIPTAAVMFGGHNGPLKGLCDVIVFSLARGNAKSYLSEQDRIADVSPVIHHPHLINDFPGSRWGHTMSSLGTKASISLVSDYEARGLLKIPECVDIETMNSVFVFGGKNQEKAMNELWMLNFAIGKNGQGLFAFATQLHTLDAPAARFNHAAATILMKGPHGLRPYLIVHGGHACPTLTANRGHMRTSHIYSDVHLLDLATLTWFTPTIDFFASEVSSKSMTRFSHSILELPFSKVEGKQLVSGRSDPIIATLLVVGGECSEPCDLGSLFVNISVAKTTPEMVPTFHITFLPLIANDSYGGAVLSNPISVPSSDSLHASDKYKYPLDQTHRVHPTALISAKNLPLFSRHTAHIVTAQENARLQENRQDKKIQGKLFVLGGGCVCFAFGSQSNAPSAAALHDIYELYVQRMKEYHAAGHGNVSLPTKILQSTAHSPIHRLYASSSGDIHFELSDVSSLTQVNTILVHKNLVNRMRLILQEKNLFDWTRKVGPLRGPAELYCPSKPIDDPNITQPGTTVYLPPLPSVDLTLGVSVKMRQLEEHLMGIPVHPSILVPVAQALLTQQSPINPITSGDDATKLLLELCYSHASSMMFANVILPNFITSKSDQSKVTTATSDPIATWNTKKKVSPSEVRGGKNVIAQLATICEQFLKAHTQFLMNNSKLTFNESDTEVTIDDVNRKIEALCVPGSKHGVPSKVEWIADILVLPKSSFSHPWFHLPFPVPEFKSFTSCANDANKSPSTSVEPMTLATTPFWDLIAQFFKIERIAVHSEIDVGPTRRSKLRLLRTIEVPDAYKLPGDLPPPDVIAIQSAKQAGIDQEALKEVLSAHEIVPEKQKSLQCNYLTDLVTQNAYNDTSAPMEHGDLYKDPDIGAVNTSSGGWVHIREQNLSYIVDISRVMFSSGNVTEKQRMGNLILKGRDKVLADLDAHRKLVKQWKGGKNQDKNFVPWRDLPLNYSFDLTQSETIVDMFVGIGYFSIPLLRVGAGHVHCVDWNPDAVACLKINMHMNKIHPSRYTIWPGDNMRLLRITQLWDTADRILLGLIPSSQRSWKIAARLLKREFGWIHVHMNVREDQVEQLIQRVEHEISELGRECGKPWVVKVKHVEKVKQYAPRVWHVVLDTMCSIPPN